MKQHSKRKSEQAMKTFLNLSVAVFTLSLTACNGNGIDMYAPGTMSHSRVQVKEKNFTDTVNTADVDRTYLSGLSSHFDKYGDGKLDIVVTYDPRSYSNTAMKATEKAADFADDLREIGVSGVHVDVLPVKDSGDVSQTSVSYNGHYADAPKDCNNMLPGLSGDAVEEDPDYKLGCSIETLLARQIARPSDLAGRGSVDPITDGRAAANKVDLYRTGAQNEQLGGEQASGE